MVCCKNRILGYPWCSVIHASCPVLYQNYKQIIGSRYRSELWGPFLKPHHKRTLSLHQFCNSTVTQEGYDGLDVQLGEEEVDDACRI